nr:RNA-directed DNA polymerase, eukaryota, reverse transcriptase zinc-binding domain protein [Tanacetum cinerariifolium]
MVRNTSTIQDTNGWCWKFRNNKQDSSIPIRNQFYKKVEKIASSFYITNFPDYVDAKRLWVECQSYGRIVDAFITYKRSKAGKRFGFVRFLGVKNEEQLARSLASIWIGSYHLFAYVARFNRQKKNEAFFKNNGDKTTNSIPSQKADHGGSSKNKKSYASSLNGDRDSKVEKQVTIAKGNTLSNVPLTPSLITPALVLDDSCAAIHDFVSDERVVWVDIEGVPLYVWSRETFFVGVGGGIMVRNTSTIQDTNGWCWKFRNNKQDSSIPIKNQFYKEVEKIASSFYITNFPDYVDAKRLWVECQSYGRIVDAFITYKRSKAGKRFGFVRFLGVKNEEQLARSLASIWIGSYHLFAYVARFNRQEKNEAFFKNNRDKKTNSIPSQKADHGGSSQNKKSYASSLNGDRDSKVEKQVTIAKGNTLLNVPLTPSLITPALVLDDSCAAIHDFVSDEHVVWVDIEGVPLYVWSREMFLKIDKKWGETMDIEENLVSSFARKRLLYPGGVTTGDDHRGVDLNTETDKVNSPLVHTKVMNNSQKVHENVTSNRESAFNYSHNAHNEGLILEVLDDMIRVGQSMGYAIERCMKDIEHIIGTQGVDVVPK